MSKSSRLTRPSSAGPGSKLPSPRKEFPGATKARMLGVGEKLMRAGNDGVLNRQKASTDTVRQEKEHCESQAGSQSQTEKNQKMVTPRSVVSPPKASSQQQVYSQSKSP
ncbi:hypothetical protein OJAV_G00197090 [Oryzias javanicus]|uniref:Uncharacterized protein n=1 Tax=Oryzias javanicus TaxID=123683 RepID=A0A3S2MG59_ORYJA|nr:hypothetical protein OJAV_G00197090 [Oryzias javanicus]